MYYTCIIYYILYAQYYTHIHYTILHTHNNIYLIYTIHTQARLQVESNYSGPISSNIEGENRLESYESKLSENVIEAEKVLIAFYELISQVILLLLHNASM